MHEDFRGMNVCRACDYIALRFPCSTATLQEKAALDALSFDLE